MITLKEHNVKPYAQLCEMLAVHQKCAYIAATGTGKSYVVGKYIEDHELVDKTLVLVPSSAIQDNWRKLLPGIQIITYQALCTEGFMLGEKDLIVCDEMHHLGARKWGEVYNKIIEGFTGKLIGITATPIRFLDKGRNMVQEAFDGISVEGLDLPCAIVAGILPSFEYITALYNLPSRIPNDDRRNETTEKLFSKLDFMKSTYSFQNIIKKHLDAEKHKVAVFVNQIVDIAEVKELCMGLFPNAGHYEIHSKKKRSEAKKTISAFEADSNMAFIYTVDMLNEGVHISGVDTVIMFRKTESPNVYLQQIGRALSSDMAETKVKIFDFVANHRNLKAVKGGSGSVIDWVFNETSNSSRQIVIRDYALEELKVLDKINRIVQGQFWTEAEDQLVRDNYSKEGGMKYLLSVLPERSRDGIRRRAKILGCDMIRNRVSSNLPWTKEEDEIIIANADMTASNLGKLLPIRSEQSINARRKALGYGKKKWTRWTEEMNKILVENPEMTAAELQEKFFPDIKKSVINKHRHKKLGVPSSYFWDEKRVSIMREVYPKEGIKGLRRYPEFNDVTNECVYAEAKHLGLSTNRHKPWRDDELEILRDYLAISEGERPASVKEFADKLPMRSIRSIEWKLRQLEEEEKKEAKANGTDKENTDSTDTKTEA